MKVLTITGLSLWQRTTFVTETGPMRTINKTTGFNMLNLTPAAAEFDPNRVNQVRTKLEEDDYIVDTLQIADRVIDLELALSGKS